MNATNDLRVLNSKALIPPALLKQQVTLDQTTKKHIISARKQIIEILQNNSDRLILIVGPCSIHDPLAALEYAEKLRPLIDQHQEDLLIIMRVYFEKPRTRVGWKGLINDPNLDGSFDINKGLSTARSLLLEINRLGVATGSEFLDTIIPQYLSDLTSWSAIGARTTESQIHRELASGLSMPVGFKNSTDGNVQIAVDAVCAAAHAHHFLGVSEHGLASIVSTKGNHDCHIILRGSSLGPNYDEQAINQSIALLKSSDLTPKLMVDLSHGNSSKDFRRQKNVAEAIAKQIEKGSNSILGVMIESNLKEGNQTLTNKHQLTYGQSITDACVSFDETKVLLADLASATQYRRRKNRAND